MEDNRKLICTTARRGKLLLVEPLPFHEDKKLADDTIPFLAFEWIGKRNYLCEHNWGTRGANCTSADFAFRFRRNDGQIQLVLGEWKYTEEYGKSPRKDSKTLSTQMGIYRIAFGRWQGDRPDFPEYRAFFVEPFYQLMRQTLLAQEMERARINGGGEMEADIVSVLHISPEANVGFSTNFQAAKALADYGSTVGAAWTKLVGDDRFLALSTESFLSVIDQAAPEDWQPWREYLLSRYGWWR